MRAATAPVKLAEHLTHRVMALIGEQHLQPGDRLPSVRELSERFSVATPTMREALRLLQMAGNLDIRHGSGIYVRQAEARFMVTNPLAGTMGAATILSLLKARLVIEPSVAGEAAESATPAQIEALSQLLDAAESHLSGGEDEDAVLGVTNMRFHRLIAEAGANTILAEIVVMLTEMHIKEQMAVLDLYNDRLRDHEQHRAILAAIARRDAEGARALMAGHLGEVIAVLTEKLERAPGA